MYGDIFENKLLSSSFLTLQFQKENKTRNHPFSLVFLFQTFKVMENNQLETFDNNTYKRKKEKKGKMNSRMETVNSEF